MNFTTLQLQYLNEVDNEFILLILCELFFLVCHYSQQDSFSFLQREIIRMLGMRVKKTLSENRTRELHRNEVINTAVVV